MSAAGHTEKAKAKASGKERLRLYLIGFLVLWVAHLVHFAVAALGKGEQAQVVRLYYAANFVFLAMVESWLIRLPISLYNRVLLPAFEWIFPRKTGVRGATLTWITGQPISDDDPELRMLVRNASFWLGLVLGLFFYLQIPAEVTRFELGVGRFADYSLVEKVLGGLLGGQSFALQDAPFARLFGRYLFAVSICVVMMDLVALFFTLSDTGRRVFKPLLLEVREARSVTEPLPPCPFDPKNEKFELSFFTIERAGREVWFVCDEKTNFTSHVVFGEPGSGKTQAFILSFLWQTIFWQAHNSEKKAAGIVFDPKAELAKEAMRLLKEAGREADIVHLRIGADTEINPILVKDPLKGTGIELGVSYVMAAWITSQGGSTSDPYWMQTAQILLSIAYTISVCENQGWTSLTELYRVTHDLAEGIKTQTGGLEKRVTINRSFAERWYGIQLAINPGLDLEGIVPHLPEEDDPRQFIERILERAERFRGYLQTMPEVLWEDAATIVTRNLDTYTSLYEKIPVENRNQALTNIIPFLRSFINPAVERAICGRKEFVLDDMLEKEGKWIVLDIPESYGPQLVRDITVLIKYRFQKTVLALGAEAKSQGRTPRVKVMVMEEGHKLLTCGSAQAAAAGDAEFFDLCRSSRCSALIVTQGIDSLYNSVGNKDAVHTVLTNIRAQYGIGVTSPHTREYLLSLFGKALTQRKSTSLGESQAGVAFDARAEEFASSSDSLSLSTSVSEVLEDRFQSTEFSEAFSYTCVGSAYDGSQGRNVVGKFYLKPQFWPHKRDSFRLMAMANFQPENREAVIEGLLRRDGYKARLKLKMLEFLGAELTDVKQAAS